MQSPARRKIENFICLLLAALCIAAAGVLEMRRPPRAPRRKTYVVCD